ncbi:helix-turn-helix transcriptional regulator [Streptomyces sp. DSM 42041]|uniref:Helix-turn-helix transcriptional regulator n=1 Tax=Streptomyces hazeniae TaxID=3075538 RepID=A0ABU2NZR1_9ACTN|nr:helix-turn-helix transcriptional regulator [Streptomyces sp. DSM 42041]MDT0381452.1 helix-turn-helix transcriptional regulator [Streptomyces sp. DSM 42041]
MSQTFGDRLRELRGSRSLRDVAALASVGKSYVSDLEHGRRRPTRAIADALDHALDAGGELTALASVDPAATVQARAGALQKGLHDALAAGPMTDAGLDDWEYTVARHGRATRTRPEGNLLADLVDDFADLRLVLTHRHPAPVRRRLTLASAHMAGLMALTLLKMGDPTARDWWRTGRAAAAAAEDRAAMSWIYAHQAYQAYYLGDMDSAVELAARAQQLAGGLPCVGPALAAPLEARALAVLGRAEAAAGALERAEVALERLPEQEQIGSAFGYSENQLRFHAGNAWTHLGDTARAAENHGQALALYPADDLTDRTLIRLDQAMCIVQDGDLAGAATTATAAIEELPREHRSALIIYRAEQLADRVPRQAQTVPEVRVLRETLALPSGRGRD